MRPPANDDWWPAMHDFWETSAWSWSSNQDIRDRNGLTEDEFADRIEDCSGKLDQAAYLECLIYGPDIIEAEYRVADSKPLALGSGGTA